MYDQTASVLFPEPTPVGIEPVTDPDSLDEQVLRSKRPEIELAGWIVLVPVLLGVVWVYALNLAISGVEVVFSGLDYPYNDPLLASVELVVFVLTSIAVPWLRPLAERIRSLRETSLGPFLTLLMAASLIGFLAYLVWSTGYPQASVGPDDFGFTRWLGAALAVGFPLLWMPLFPRLTAILSGMIAGALIFALFGYTFFESSLSHADSCCLLGPLLYSILAIVIGFSLLSDIGWLKLVPLCGAAAVFAASFSPVATVVVMFLFVLLSAGLGLFALFKRPMSAHPLTCAVVSGLLAIGLAVLGGDFGYSCGSP